MKKIIQLSLIMCLVASFHVLNGQTVRNVDAFSQLSVSSNVNVKLVQSDQPRIEFKMVTGKEDELITEVKNEKLYVKIKSGKFSWGSKSKANVKVYYRSLNSIEVSAGASLKSESAIHADDFSVEVSSGANANLEVEAEHIDADVSSGARLSLDGSATNGHYDASSGANLDAQGLVCDNVRADVSSGARISAHVNKKLNADASSGGSIRYKGKVENVHSDSGWSGQISRMK